MSELDVRVFTVGPVQENCYIVRSGGEATSAVIVDPGEEPERLLQAAASLGVSLDAILVTHCHFDHIGAVAPLAQATGAPVYCPAIEREVLADVMRWVPAGFGPFESHEAEHTVGGGERLDLAGLQIEVVFTPGHSPGHLTYAIAAAQPDVTSGGVTGGSPAAGTPGHDGEAGRALLSGDVLFQGSVGRTDLPGADWETLERSIGTLLAEFPADTLVYPGHMGITTLGRERATNPFLAELRAEAQAAPAPGAAAAGS